MSLYVLDTDIPVFRPVLFSVLAFFRHVPSEGPHPVTG